MNPIFLTKFYDPKFDHNLRLLKEYQMPWNDYEPDEQFFHSGSEREEINDDYANQMREFIQNCLTELASRGYSPAGAIELMTDDPAPTMLGHLTWSCAEACLFLHFKQQYEEYSLGFNLRF